jgi:D-alanyl-D-alanine carboxypeptidase/D-alanyl-D-alanine-endopeptidase (penicillin-binding protein 4)
MKNYFLLICLFLYTYIQAQPSVNDSIINNPLLKHSQFGYYAEICETGKPVLDINSESSLAPASGLKTVTTSAALNLLGDDFTFKTQFCYSGKLAADGTLDGNIYIKGGGDPTLGSDLVKSSPNLDSLSRIFAAACKTAGIKKLNGSIIADETLFQGNSTPDYYPYIDMGNYYGAGTSSINLNDNLYYAYFKPGNEGGEALLLRTEPEMHFIGFNNNMLTGKPGSGDNGYIYSSPYSNTAVIRGTIPAGVREFSIKGAITDPAMFAADYFTTVLRSAGIEVSLKPSKINTAPDYTLMHNFLTVTSPKLKDIVYIINKRSFNLYAETVLRDISAYKNGDGSTESGIDIIYNFLDSIKISREGVHLYDGSGLSRADCVTPQMMAKLLSFNTKQKMFSAFYNSLGIAGDTSDISFYTRYGLGTPIQQNARIKSGFINLVRSHSGYLKAKSGRLISYSLITNNYNTSLKNIDELHKQIMIMLYNNN